MIQESFLLGVLILAAAWSLGVWISQSIEAHARSQFEIARAQERVADAIQAVARELREQNYLERAHPDRCANLAYAGRWLIENRHHFFDNRAPTAPADTSGDYPATMPTVERDTA